MIICQITDILPPIQAIGLFIDIFGTFVIAAPDIPFINIHLRGGRLRAGRAELEAGGLIKGNPGYEDIVMNLSVLHGVEFEEYPELLRAEGRNIIPGSESGKRIYAYYSPDGEENEMVSEEFCPAPYDSLRFRFREEIRKEESKVRGVGFLILASGFAIQILGIL